MSELSKLFTYFTPRITAVSMYYDNKYHVMPFFKHLIFSMGPLLSAVKLVPNSGYEPNAGYFHRYCAQYLPNVKYLSHFWWNQLTNPKVLLTSQKVVTKAKLYIYLTLIFHSRLLANSLPGLPSGISIQQQLSKDPANLCCPWRCSSSPSANSAGSVEKYRPCLMPSHYPV